MNACTKKNRYLIFGVDDILGLLSGKQFFFSLDFMSGYWQLAIALDDIEKAAFTTAVVLFEFKTMPFGLCNAPSSFQREMDSVLAGLIWRTLIVYLENILVSSTDLTAIFKICKQYFNTPTATSNET